MKKFAIILTIIGVGLAVWGCKKTASSEVELLTTLPQHRRGTLLAASVEGPYRQLATGQNEETLALWHQLAGIWVLEELVKPQFFAGYTQQTLALPTAATNYQLDSRLTELLPSFKAFQYNFVRFYYDEDIKKMMVSFYYVSSGFKTYQLQRLSFNKNQQSYSLKLKNSADNKDIKTLELLFDQQEASFCYFLSDNNQSYLQLSTLNPKKVLLNYSSNEDTYYEAAALATKTYHEEAPFFNLKPLIAEDNTKALEGLLEKRAEWLNFFNRVAFNTEAFPFVFNLYRLLVQNYQELDLLENSVSLSEHIFNEAFYGKAVYNDQADSVAILQAEVDDKKAVEQLLTLEKDLVFLKLPSTKPFKTISYNGVTLEAERLAVGALLFFTTANNDVDNLMIADLIKIYQGKINTWAQLESSNEQSILTYMQNYESVSSQFLQYFLKEPITYALKKRTNSNFLLTNAEGALGYSDSQRAAEFLAAVAAEELKILHINHSLPAFTTAKLENYPFETYIYAVYRQNELHDEQKELLAWLKSNAESSKHFFTQQGLMPISSLSEPVS